MAVEEEVVRVEEELAAGGGPRAQGRGDPQRPGHARQGYVVQRRLADVVAEGHRVLHVEEVDAVGAALGVARTGQRRLDVHGGDRRRRQVIRRPAVGQGLLLLEGAPGGHLQVGPALSRRVEQEREPVGGHGLLGNCHREADCLFPLEYRLPVLVETDPAPSGRVGPLPVLVERDGDAALHHAVALVVGQLEQSGGQRLRADADVGVHCKRRGKRIAGVEHRRPAYALLVHAGAPEVVPDQIEMLLQLPRAPAGLELLEDQRASQLVVEDHRGVRRVGAQDHARAGQDCQQVAGRVGFGVLLEFQPHRDPDVALQVHQENVVFVQGPDGAVEPEIHRRVDAEAAGMGFKPLDDLLHQGIVPRVGKALQVKG